MNNLVAFAAICEYNEVIIMDNWILKSANTLVNEQQQERTIASDEVKVKVAYAIFTHFRLGHTLIMKALAYQKIPLGGIPYV